jgi:ribA/ribD-fused uncharacterized protein
MKTTNTHVYFWGSYLSNFWLTKIQSPEGCALPNFTFNCSEQLFMMEKALFFNDYEAAFFMAACENGGSVKAIGRKVLNFDEKAWYDVSYEKMLMACKAKFAQNAVLAEQLKATGERIIVEASPTDLIWGVGLHEDDPLILNERNWRGENRLGRVLMEVRAGIDKV